MTWTLRPVGGEVSISILWLIGNQMCVLIVVVVTLLRQKDLALILHTPWRASFIVSTEKLFRVKCQKHPKAIGFHPLMYKSSLKCTEWIHGMDFLHPAGIAESPWRLPGGKHSVGLASSVLKHQRIKMDQVGLSKRSVRIVYIHTINMCICICIYIYIWNHMYIWN